MSKKTVRVGMMIKCDGCAHFIRYGRGLCSFNDGMPTEVVVSKHSNCTQTYYGFRPTVDEMRALGAECGPDARLYRPRWYRRLFLLASGNSGQAMEPT